MIPQSFIQDLLGRIDIVEVVDRYVKLKRTGANYAACCPFHTEKSPSFTVSPTKQFYHCFGCGAHGTAIGFLMEYGGMGFVDAVKDLAQGVGMQVPEEVRSEQARRREEEGPDLHGLLLQAAQYYRSQLKDAPHAIDYLRRRGLSGEIAKRFGIGYAPDGWQNLATAFPDYQDKALNAAGLVKQTDDGKRYDVFRDRIMFPIVDARGHIIGFGGRVLGDGEPKYLNTPETAVFEKGRELYGLFQARRAIRDAGAVIVVEGYMDVVALAQADVEYAVATLGTATTPVHVQKLLRQSDEVVFCFDGDAAGRRAAWRALENCLAHLSDGKQVKFLFLPDGEDPDSYVRAHGKAAFETLLAKADTLSRFLIDELRSATDMGTSEGRAKLLQQAKPLVKQIAAPMLSLLIRKELAQLAGVLQQEIDGQFEIRSQSASTVAPSRRFAPTAPVTSEQRLLRLIMGNLALAEQVSDDHLALLDTASGFASVASAIRLIRTGGVKTTGALLEAARESDYAGIFQHAAAEILVESQDDEHAETIMSDIFRQIERQQIESEYRRLSVSGVHSTEERARFQEVSRRLAALKG